VILRVRTARVTYSRPDRLDITRKSAGPDGLPFAPSWSILRPALALLRSGRMDASGWAAYVDRYTDEMRASYRDNHAAWSALLARPAVVLVCYCSITPARPWCHRRVLAGLLAKCGARDDGEVTADTWESVGESRWIEDRDLYGGDPGGGL